jgi:HAE1 family hydrophobic/amphiphilic exporter-1
MTLAEISIRRPVFAWMLMFGLIVFGAISLGRLGVSYMPDIDFPVIDISVEWEGAAPELIEAEIVDEIEQEIISVEGIKEIRSTVRQGTANITVEFEIHRNIDAALQEIQAGVAQVDLPLGVEPPIVKKSNPEEEPIMWLGINSTRPYRDLVEYVDLYIKDSFQIIPGVGEVILGGFSPRNLRIWIDNDKLKEHELTMIDLIRAVQSQHAELPGGYMENDQREWNVRTMGEGLTAADVANILITRRGGQPIYDTSIRIRDVAAVEDGTDDVRRMFRIEGRQAISLGIKKQRGTNEVEVASAVRKKVESLAKTLPPDIGIRVNVDFSRFTEQAVYFTQKELITAALVTGLVCLLFLGSWSAAFNVLLSIPTSIMGTLIVLYFFGFTLNLFTLLALALVIGIVVDDAIMVLENIVRHFHAGKGRTRASEEGAREITFAAMAATVAIIAIFLPVAFMSGIIGKFFFQFGVTISAAVSLSLLEAITLTPMRCSQLMRRSEPGWYARGLDAAMRGMSAFYGAFLRGTLRWRWIVLLGSFAIFLASLSLLKSLRQEFVPPQDQNFFRLAVETPVGSSLEFTRGKVIEVEDYIHSRSDVARHLVSIGGLDGRSNTAFVPVVLVDKDKRGKSQAQIMNEFRRDLAHIKDVRITMSDLSTRGLSPRRSVGVEFNLRGSDYAKLDQSAQSIVDRLQQTGLFVDLDTNYRKGMPELQVIPDREEAAKRGVAVDDIGETVRCAIGGVRAGKFTSDGRRYDVRLRLKPLERLEPEALAKLEIRNDYGEVVPLNSVVDWEIVPKVQTISRVDRQRAISITGNVATGKSQAEAIAAAEQAAKEILPEGYSLHLEGGSQTFKESFDSLWFTLLLGVIIAYMVLAAQFNSFIHPFTVLLALPFSLTGALATLGWFDESLNLFSMIGVILLMGIAKKNSILLVEFTNQVRERSHATVEEALARACPIRLRPILMTSFATAGAAIPLALTTAPGSEARVPMALAILGGVAVSTLFTLFVIPCAYQIFSLFERPKDLDSADDRDQPWLVEDHDLDDLAPRPDPIPATHQMRRDRIV